MQLDTPLNPPPSYLRRLGLVDYVLALVEHARLLLLLPLLLAAAVFGIAWIAPKDYTSVALLAVPTPEQGGMLPAQVASMMRSRTVLDPVLASKVVSAEPDELAERINAVVGKEGLVRLEVTAGTPAQAQALASAVLQSWFKSTIPLDRDRIDLQARAERTKANLANVQSAVEALTRSLASGERQASDAKVRLADLSETADKLFVTLQLVNRHLEGLSTEVVRQAPTLPDKPSWPRPLSVAGKTWIVALVLLSAALLVWRRIDAARTDPDIDAKLSRLFRRRKAAGRRA
ncbi:MAG: Wzz/FepE/Etk N-terminal domain-containing protein [Ramlibacter sp.]